MLDGVPPELRKPPNCIPCALWHLTSADDKETCLQAFINLETVQNSYAAERKYRAYRQCAELLKVELIPTAGACDKPGHCLLHSDNNGSPHCVSLCVLELEEAESLSVVVTDSAREYKLTAAAFADFALNSTDSSTMVFFRVSPREAEETISCLLDLQAGSSPPSSDEESTLFEQPNFIDSEFSTPRSSMGFVIPAFMLFPDLIKERISLLEGLCCDYVSLLASQPSLWNKIPSTGAALSQTEWIAEICEARRRLHTVWSSTSSTLSAPPDEAVCRVDKRLKVYMSMLRVHSDTLGAVDVMDEFPNPCDSQVSKRTWEVQAMSCRQKKSTNARGGATSDEEACLPENSFVVDDDGRVVFADIVLDSLEEETKKYLAICVNNIRKINGRFKCALCPFRSFCRLRQLRDHVQKYHSRKSQFLCSGTKQMKIILALHDADCVQRTREGNFLWRSSLILQRDVEPLLACETNNIDKSLRLVLTGLAPKYVNVNNIGATTQVRRMLNIYYDRALTEILYREIVLHHSNAPWLNVRYMML